MEAVTGAPQVFDEETNALDWFQKKTVEGFRYWAGFTQYKIKFDDGSKTTYERQPFTKVPIRRTARPLGRDSGHAGLEIR